MYTYVFEAMANTKLRQLKSTPESTPKRLFAPTPVPTPIPTPEEYLTPTPTPVRE
jgi:hypothetical protein